MNYENHLYMILYPSNFLISSQLTPEELGQHYLTGSKQNYDSGLIFAEIDNTYRHDYLDIDWGFEQLVPHDDGSPKATKFISSYRVLEHIELNSIKRLYLSVSTFNPPEMSIIRLIYYFNFEIERFCDYGRNYFILNYLIEVIKNDCWILK